MAPIILQCPGDLPQPAMGGKLPPDPAKYKLHTQHLDADTNTDTDSGMSGNGFSPPLPNPETISRVHSPDQGVDMAYPDTAGNALGDQCTQCVYSQCQCCITRSNCEENNAEQEWTDEQEWFGDSPSVQYRIVEHVEEITTHHFPLPGVGDEVPSPHYPLPGDGEEVPPTHYPLPVEGVDASSSPYDRHGGWNSPNKEWYKERHYQSSRDGHSLPDLSSPSTHTPHTLPFPDLPSPSTVTPQTLPFPEFGADLVTCDGAPYDVLLAATGWEHNWLFKRRRGHRSDPVQMLIPESDENVIVGDRCMDELSSLSSVSCPSDLSDDETESDQEVSILKEENNLQRFLGDEKNRSIRVASIGNTKIMYQANNNGNFPDISLKTDQLINDTSSGNRTDKNDTSNGNRTDKNEFSVHDMRQKSLKQSTKCENSSELSFTQHTMKHSDEIISSLQKDNNSHGGKCVHQKKNCVYCERPNKSCQEEPRVVHVIPKAQSSPENVDVEDASILSPPCIVPSNASSLPASQPSVWVSEAPPTTQIVPKGRGIRISCRINARAPVGVSWYSDGQLVSASGGVHILRDGSLCQLSVFPHSRHYGGGTYSVAAYTSQHTVWAHCKVGFKDSGRVQLLPSFVRRLRQLRLSDHSTNGDTQSQTSVVLECQTAGHPEPIVNVFKDAKILHNGYDCHIESDQYGSWKIRIHKPSDQSIYRATANNLIGSSVSEWSSYHETRDEIDASQQNSGGERESNCNDTLNSKCSVLKGNIIETKYNLPVSPNSGLFLTAPEPGTIAAREHLKWSNAVPLSHNPYSPTELSQRLKGDSPYTCLPPDGRDICFEAASRDLSRHSRDYYVPKNTTDKKSSMYESFDSASPVEDSQDRVSGNEAINLSEHQQHSQCKTSSETFVGASIMEVPKYRSQISLIKKIHKTPLALKVSKDFLRRTSSMGDDFHENDSNVKHPTNQCQSFLSCENLGNVTFQKSKIVKNFEIKSLDRKISVNQTDLHTSNLSRQWYSEANHLDRFTEVQPLRFPSVKSLASKFDELGREKSQFASIQRSKSHRELVSVPHTESSVNAHDQTSEQKTNRRSTSQKYKNIIKNSRMKEVYSLTARSVPKHFREDLKTGNRRPHSITEVASPCSVPDETSAQTKSDTECLRETQYLGDNVYQPYATSNSTYYNFTHQPVMPKYIRNLPVNSFSKITNSICYDSSCYNYSLPIEYGTTDVPLCVESNPSSRVTKNHKVENISPYSGGYNDVYLAHSPRNQSSHYNFSNSSHKIHNYVNSNDVLHTKNNQNVEEIGSICSELLDESNSHSYDKISVFSEMDSNNILKHRDSSPDHLGIPVYRAVLKPGIRNRNSSQGDTSDDGYVTRPSRRKTLSRTHSLVI